MVPVFKTFEQILKPVSKYNIGRVFNGECILYVLKFCLDILYDLLRLVIEDPHHNCLCIIHIYL